MASKYSHRHYEDSARIFAQQYRDIEEGHKANPMPSAEYQIRKVRVDIIRDAFIDLYTRDNPRFDRRRFLDATKEGL